ncbi:NADP-dependent oxidoreductase [Sinimarinibacterium flocculans]|uniref:NADP-dependent oxidoreductase n=1 Tax=Sinimarinibacterium flocculans TaxID=985250 RepID=UPI002490752C|nr:NADP-dependent oxidoreductase [Sinimarinibacterium flocculans]
MSLISREVHLVVRPEGVPEPTHFAVRERRVPELEVGELLIRNRVMSVDPYMRPRLSSGLTPLDTVLDGGAVGEVVASRNAAFPEGAQVLHGKGFREFAVSDGKGVEVIEVSHEGWGAHLGVLGMTGFTAYAGLLEVGELKAGERVFVSAAAGAVGSVAAQIARIKGCYVGGSAGSAEKCKWLRDVARLDAVVNYRDGVLRKLLKKAFPEGIDVFFDNVGGEHLNAALPRMRMRGRIPLCGMISSYNNKGALSDGITTLSTMMYNRLTMRGFIQSDYLHLRPQFLAEMRRWIASGELRYAETVFDGIERAPEALIGLLRGDNLGKMLVRLN